MSDNQTKAHKKLYFKIRSIFLQASILLIIWLVFSGKYDVMHITFGIVGVILVILMNYRLSRVNLFPEREEPNIPIKIYRLPVYILWLVKEIFLANLQVAYLVIHPEMPIEPKLLTFRTKLPSASAKVILGNSITITPGTLTVDIEHNKFLVHCLTPRSAGSLQTGDMQMRIMKLFQNDLKDAVYEFEFIQNKNTEELNA